MFSKISFFVLLLSFSALLAIAGDHNAVLRHESGSAWSRRHARARDIVREPRSIQFAARDSTNTTSSKIFNPGEKKRDLEKRFEGARFTFYDAGMGACGATNTNADFIVAMNSAQFSGSCFQTITITANGRTTQATVADQCPGCPMYGLDFSRGLFNFFAPESAGVLEGSWVFGNGVPTPTPMLTPTPTPTPTLTTSALSSSSNVVDSFISSSSASALSVPTSAPSPEAPAGNLQLMQLVFIELAAISSTGA